jgi:hypothetical protein
LSIGNWNGGVAGGEGTGGGAGFGFGRGLAARAGLLGGLHRRQLALRLLRPFPLAGQVARQCVGARERRSVIVPMSHVSSR